MRLFGALENPPAQTPSRVVEHPWGSARGGGEGHGENGPRSPLCLSDTNDAFLFLFC